MNNIPEVKVGIVAVSRDCFPESLSVNRREALVKNVEDFHEVDDVYAKVFIGSVKPARVAFGGNDIPKGALVEIDAIAAL